MNAVAIVTPCCVKSHPYIQPHIQQGKKLKLTLPRHRPKSTTHIRPLSLPLPLSFILPMLRIGPEFIPIQNKLPATTRTPPCDTEMRPFDIHLAATQRLPEPFHALLMHIWCLDAVK